MGMKDNIDIQEIKNKQVKQIKDCIIDLINKYPNYYKDKEYAQKFLNIDKKK